MPLVNEMSELLQIYDLIAGRLLLSVVCDNMLTAVSVSPLETDVFVGTDSGPILQMSLLTPPRHLEYHLTDTDSVLIYTGHTRAVRSLSASFTGELLLSGSADSTVKVSLLGSLYLLDILKLYSSPCL